MKTVKLFKIAKGDFKEDVLCIRPVIPQPNDLQKSLEKIYKIFKRSGYSISNNLVIYHPISLGIKATYDAFQWTENENFITHQYIEQNWNILGNGNIDDIVIAEFTDFEYTIKYFQVRDRGTNMPCLCIQFNGNINSFRESLIRESIFCHFLEIGEGNFDVNAWNSVFRTKQAAHKHINLNWEILNNGDVIDVEYILGEKDTIKKFE